MKNDNTLDEAAKKEIAKHVSCDESARIHDLANRMFKAGAAFERERINSDLKRWSKILDSIKYDLYASVYTLTDDEFEQVFFVRDEMDIFLNERVRGTYEEIF